MHDVKLWSTGLVTCALWRRCWSRPTATTQWLMEQYLMEARSPLWPLPSTTLFMVFCISHCLNMFEWFVCVYFTVCVFVREKERHENDSVEVCVFWCDSEVPQVTERERSISTPASRRTTWTASALGSGAPHLRKIVTRSLLACRPLPWKESCIQQLQNQMHFCPFSSTLSSMCGVHHEEEKAKL